MSDIEETLEIRRKKLKAQYPVWNSMTIYERFLQTAMRYKEMPFVMERNKSYTYGMVLDQVHLLAKALKAAGLQEQDCVAVIMSNRIEFIFLTFALAQIGAVKVPVNKNAGSAEVSYILKQTRAKIMFSERFQDIRLKNKMETLEKIICLDVQNLEDDKLISWDRFMGLGNGKKEEFFIGNPEYISDVIYTSGSTGKPKGVMLTHDMILRCAYANCLNRGFGEGRRIYVPIPLFHVYGYVEGVIAALFVGGSVVIYRGKFDAEMALDIMESYQVNDILSVPSIMMKMLQCPKLDTYNLASLKAVYCSASLCPKWIWGAIREKFMVEEVVTGYGMSEVAGASMQTDPLDETAVLESRVGKILEGGCAGAAELEGKIIEYKVFDLETGAESPRGGIGELYCRGPIVTTGYYNYEEANRITIDSEGWLRTGDIGYFDEKGYFRYMGRCNDTYKINGENVSPLFLDRIISKCPGVNAIETVGVPDDRLGWISVAFVDVGEAGVEVQQKVIKYCRVHLASYQVPKYFYFMNNECWPKTSTGKVQKYKLRKMAEKMLECEQKVEFN